MKTGPNPKAGARGGRTPPPLVGEITQERQEPAAADLVAAAYECLELLRRARGNDRGTVRGEHRINEMAADVADAASDEDPLPVRVVMADLRS